MLQVINPLFSRRTPGNSQEIVPIDNCHINYSKLYAFNGEGKSRCFSLKFVLKGLEQYKVNNRRHEVTEGSYLVVAQGSDISVEIKSKEIVEGLRFFITEKMVEDVWATINSTPEKLLEGVKLNDSLPDFFEHKFGTVNDNLGNFITDVGHAIKQNTFEYDKVNDEFFYRLGFELCKQQGQHFQNMATISAQKKSTREELYRRLLDTRDYIHDNLDKPISLPELSLIASISEFHLLRSFKSVFGESPYQYLLNLRLQMAKNALLNNNQNITELAQKCGFKEVQAFSKLFRRQFGVGPSKYRQQAQK